MTHLVSAFVKTNRTVFGQLAVNDKSNEIEVIPRVYRCWIWRKQPLHCAERSKDKGGNRRLVFFLTQQRWTNLHSVWDGSISMADKGDMSVAYKYDI